MHKKDMLSFIFSNMTISGFSTILGDLQSFEKSTFSSMGTFLKLVFENIVNHTEMVHISNNSP